MERNEFKTLSHLSKIPWDSTSILCEHGASVEEIIMTDRFSLDFRLVKQHCPNLQTLCISQADVISESMAEFRGMIVALKNLTSVELEIRHNDASDIIYCLKELGNLQTLMLDLQHYDDPPLDLANLHKCVHLETLKIKGIHTFVIVLDDLLHLKRLRCLRIQNGNFISYAQEIAFGLPALEELEIFYSFMRTSFPDCPKLRSLHLKHFGTNSASCQWISKKLQTLESLRADHLVFNEKYMHPNPQSEWVLPTLKDLMIYDAKRSLIFPLPYCPMLTSLNLAQVEEFPKECNDWLARHKETLNSLELPGLSFGDCSFEVPSFPKLRAFRLNSSYALSEDRFFNWLFKHSATMEILNIYAELDRSRLLQAISDCKNMGSFRIARTEPAFQESFFTSLFDILKENGVTPDNPFKFKCPSENLCQQQLDVIRDFPYSQLCEIQIDNTIGTFWETYNEIA